MNSIVAKTEEFAKIQNPHSKIQNRLLALQSAGQAGIAKPCFFVFYSKRQGFF